MTPRKMPLPPPPPQEPGTQYFTLTPEDWCVPALGGRRPAPVLEPRPQEGTRRHGGIGYELVLATAVPQLGAQEAERALPAFLQQREEEAAELERMKKISDKIFAGLPVSAAEMTAWRQWAGAPSQPSSSGGKRRKKRKRRKKKVPKRHSSSSLRFGAMDQGNMFE